MSIYEINENKLSVVSKENIKLEHNLQKLTEENLDTLFGLRFIRTEFQLHKLRLDTLAFDDETKSFVIIEYKRDSSFSLIDQGYAYLALLLNNKADFILAYNEKTGESLKVNDVEWSQSRVIFIAQRYTIYQLKAMEFRDLPFELWKVAKYANDTISFEKIITEKDRDDYIDIVGRDSLMKSLKSYGEKTPFKNAKTDLITVYAEFKRRFEAEYVDSDITVTKTYIGFNKDGKRVLNYYPFQTYSSVYLIIKGIKFEDEFDLGKYSKSKYNKSDFYTIPIHKVDDLDKVFLLLEKIVD